MKVSEVEPRAGIFVEFWVTVVEAIRKGVDTGVPEILCSVLVYDDDMW